MNIIQEASLWFQEGRSDKVYHLQLRQGTGGYIVSFQYGRRGSALNEGLKTPANGSPVPLDQARKIYNRVLNEKLGKGYQEQSGASAPRMSPAAAVPAATPQRAAPVPVTNISSPVPHRFINWADEELPAGPEVSSLETPRGDIIFIPQLLNCIEEADIETYLRDDRYCSQEKKDGRHQPFHKKAGEVLVTNKKGKSIGFPEALKTAIKVGGDLLVDAEIIGDKFHAFDLLEIDGEDLRENGYQHRYEVLKTLFSSEVFDTQHISLVPLAVGYQAKKDLYTRLKAEGREGMVFKLIDAPYTPGKAHAAMWKCKFYSTVSARVVKGREGKHSIGLELLSAPNGDWLFMGNCTVPPNKDIPEIGSIVEIKMLYCNRGGSFYQPSYLGVRDDVDAEECLLSQVKYKPEE